MKSIGRGVFWLIPVALSLVGLLWPLALGGASSGGTNGTDPVVFSVLRADFALDRDGLLEAEETITAEFPDGRHGIFRFWDVGNANNSRIRQVPEVRDISLDGASVPFQLQWQDNDRFLVAKIGDPDSFVTPGRHVYRIRYSIAGALDPGSIGAEKDFASSTGDPVAASVFYWNVIAPGWSNQIDRAEISLSAPGRLTGAQCSIGTGVGRECDGLTIEGATVRLSATDLAPRTPITLRAAVDITTPPRAELPWSLRWDPVLGRSVPVVLGLLGLTAAGGLGALLLWRTTVETTPGFPLRYAPPKDLGPVQFEYIRTEKVPTEGLTATMFYLAEQGLLSLNQDAKQKWTVVSVGRPGAWAEVDPVSAAVGEALALTQQGRKFKADGSVTAGQQLTSAKAAMAAGVRQWALGANLLVKRRSELLFRFFNIAALVLAFLGFVRSGFPITLWGLPFAAFFLVSLLAWRSGVGTRRTPAGRQLWSEVGGFHRMLATDSAESRFDFSARKDLYTAYIPFAIAGGTAALWAAKYQAATGQVPPQPGWYHSSSGTGGSSLA